MAQVIFNPASGIIGISGRLGPLIFYRRNGKQFVRTQDKSCTIQELIESSSDHYRSIFGPFSVHSRK